MQMDIYGCYIIWKMNHIEKLSELSVMSELVIKFNSLFGTVDTGVHIVHRSCVIITYTLESLSSLK